MTGSPCVVESSDYHQLTFGTAISDSLTSKTCIVYYQFTTTAQVNFRITLTSPGVETFVQVADSTGVIRVNSVLTSSLDTTTTLRLMLAPGGYQVSVIPYNTGQSAEYTLLAAGDSSAVAGCTPVWLTPGITTTQTITHNDCTKGPSGSTYLTHVYALLLKSGQEVAFSEYSTSMSPLMTLYGPDGTENSTADSLGTSAVINTTVGSKGTYELWVGNTVAGQAGTYQLTVQPDTAFGSEAAPASRARGRGGPD